MGSAWDWSREKVCKVEGRVVRLRVWRRMGRENQEFEREAPGCVRRCVLGEKRTVPERKVPVRMARVGRSGIWVFGKWIERVWW